MRDTVVRFPGPAGEAEKRLSPQLPLRVEDLRFHAKNRPLLDIDTLEITSPGPTVVMGPNGAGKSLLLRILHGLVTPETGSVTFQGRPADPVARQRQALVFQKPVILRRSVAANLRFALKAHGVPRRDRGDRTRELLTQAGLQEQASQPARTLSGGEQQRLAVIRAMAHRPDVLFMDEPTASLDPAATHAIELLVGQAAAQGTKVIMVTHDPGQARRIASDVVFLHNGRVAEHTSALRFFADPDSPQARAYLAGGLLL